jgi:hypothetical protein
LPRLKTMTSSEFLTTPQLADRWHIHQNTLIKWRKIGKGPFFTRIEGNVLYSLAEVELYEQANLITHEP